MGVYVISLTIQHWISNLYIWVSKDIIMHVFNCLIQQFIGLPLEPLLTIFQHRTLELFKLILLERRVSTLYFFSLHLFILTILMFRSYLKCKAKQIFLAN